MAEVFDVSALGELLVDFTPAGISENMNPIFERNPGGAPANVMAALAKFGKNTAFIGKVGKDLFGDYLADVLNSYKVNTSGLLQTDKYNTTLAFVCLDSNGDRTFSFYRNPGADLMLFPYEVDKNIIDASRIFHFGSVSMTGEPAREATLYAAEYARNSGKVVSYDPNLRLPLWTSREEAKKYIPEGFKFADIIKISDDELEFLFDTSDLSRGSELISKTYGTKVIVVTMGAKGSYYRFRDSEGHIPALDVETVDTTGAGDTFTAGLLFKLLENGLDLDGMPAEEFRECVRFGVAAGSLSTRKKGAIPSIPELREILERV